MERGTLARTTERFFERPAPESAPPGERPLDHVPRDVLARAYHEAGIDADPIEVAAEHGVDSEAVTALCQRGYLRVAEAALPFDAAESVKRMWEALAAVDSRTVRRFPHCDRDNYFRDEAAWEAVFFDHVRRQVA